jgi:hypothetical protein
MKENKPCRDAQGLYYWPKVYFMEENEAKAVNSIDHQEIRTLQGDIHLILPGLPLTQELQPFPRNSWVFSKELDDSPHPSS